MEEMNWAVNHMKGKTGPAELIQNYCYCLYLLHLAGEGFQRKQRTSEVIYRNQALFAS